MKRKGNILRETKETSIKLSLDLDGKGNGEIDTGIGFMDHMLESFSRHGRFDLTVLARGDLGVDMHHTIEDLGIVLGNAIRDAVGEGKGIERFADVSVPMDEALAETVLDVGGRGYLVWNADLPGNVSGIPPDLFEHFFYSMCINACITAHISAYGLNSHHVAEAIFKSFGIALHRAVRIGSDDRTVPSTKGTF